MAAYLVTYVQEDIDRLVTFGPFETLHAAATFAWGMRAAAVRYWNEERGCAFVAKDDGIDEIAASGVAVYFDEHGNEQDEAHFRIDTPRDPATFDPALLTEF